MTCVNPHFFNCIDDTFKLTCPRIHRLVPSRSGAAVNAAHTDAPVTGTTEPLAAAGGSCTFPHKQATFEDDLANSLVRGGGEGGCMLLAMPKTRLQLAACLVLPCQLVQVPQTHQSRLYFTLTFVPFHWPPCCRR